MGPSAYSVDLLPLLRELHQNWLHTQIGQKLISNLRHREVQRRGIDTGMASNSHPLCNRTIQNKLHPMTPVKHKCQNGGRTGLHADTLPYPLERQKKAGLSQFARQLLSTERLYPIPSKGDKKRSSGGCRAPDSYKSEHPKPSRSQHSPQWCGPLYDPHGHKRSPADPINHSRQSPAAAGLSHPSACRKTNGMNCHLSHLS